MSGPRKIHIHGSTLFITMSIEEGLLLLCNPLIRALLCSALARAQELHPLKICHFVVEATHIHLVVVVDNPNDVAGFLERFKTESAHSINRLLGRKKRTVWCEGYDSPVLLTAEDTVREISYTYVNPAKDKLVDSIEEYPGLSTWKMYQQGKHEKDCAWIRRPAVPCILGRKMTLRDYNALAGELMGKAKYQHTLKIEPNAWMECFGIVSEEERAEWNRKIVQEVKMQEEQYRLEREVAGKGVVGRERLLRQQLDPSYRPERDGQRSWCVCSDRSLRKSFISYVKELVQQAREVYRRWRKGDYSVPFPLGLYPPSMPKLAEVVSLW